MFSRLAVLLTSIALLLAGCAGDPKEDGSNDLPEVGGPLLNDGTFRLAIPYDPGSLDFGTNIGTSTQLQPFAYDALVATLDGKDLVPNLATTWTLESDSLTFEIREDVTCSDGSAVTPEIIAESFAFFKTPEAQARIFGDVTNWEVSGDDAAGTVVFQFGEPVGFAVELLADVPVVCGEGLDDRSILENETSGSGPYVLTDSVPNDRYVLTRRDDYTWGPKGATTDEPGLPKTVELRVIESPPTAVNLLLSDELDAAGLPQSAGKRIDGEARIMRVPKDMGQMVFNNDQDRITGEAVVRQALTMALDREGLAAVANGSLATDLSPPYTNPCADPANGESIPAYDPEAAAQLLDDAGWVVGDDGIRENEGSPAKLDVFVGNDFPAEWIAASELAVKAWRDLGFDAEMRVLIGNAQLQAVVSGDFDVAAMAAISGPVPSHVTGLITGSAPPDGSNIPRIDNPEYVAHVQKALTSPDTESACVEWNAAQSALYEQANLVPVVTGDRLFAAGSNIEFGVTTYGFVPTSIRMHQD